MAMPRAAGLFHKVIVQSRSMLHRPGPDQTAKLADAVLKELGIAKANLEQAHTVPIRNLGSRGQAENISLVLKGLAESDKGTCNTWMVV